MLLEEGDERGAREVFGRVDPAWYDHPVNKVALTFIPWHVSNAA
jgi:hypothetical protein